MKKLILGTALCALAVAAPSQDRDEHRDHGHGEDHDNGKHKGWDKHDRNDHHDNGRHEGWEKHEVRDNYRGWDHEHDRIVPGRHYPRGHYEHVREVFVARSIDYRTRNVILYDCSNWVVALVYLLHCRDWRWDRDQVYVYDDDHHACWYLLFNAWLRRSVHVEFSGVR